nr:formimidoylglutamase [Paraglaciecola hydrolytica]
MQSKHYFNWQGRIDEEDAERGLRWHQVIDKNSGSNESCSLIGFACDLGVKANKGREGAVLGPTAIRAALANMAWHAPTSLFDKGDIIAHGKLESAQQDFATLLIETLQGSSFVVGLGGGHEIAWGSYQGLQQHLAHSDKKIGIINFDAHFDLRKPAPLTSSGTPFWQIAQHCEQQGEDFHYACIGISEAANTKALFDMATSTNTRYLLDSHCNEAKAKALLTPLLAEIDELYVTICLDAFPANAAPGVSAPSALGISPQFVINMLHWLAQSQSDLNFNWQLADVAEMNPTYDIDNRTAKLAARLIFELVQAKFNQCAVE